MPSADLKRQPLKVEARRRVRQSLGDPPPVLLLQLPASVIIWVNQRQCKRRKRKKKRLGSQRLPLKGITPPPPPPPPPTHRKALYGCLRHMPLSGFAGVTSIRADSCGDGEPSLGVRFLSSLRAAGGAGGGRKLCAGNKSGKRSVCAINPPRLQAPQLIISDGLFASQTMRCDFQPQEQLGGRANK